MAIRLLGALFLAGALVTTVTVSSVFAQRSADEQPNEAHVGEPHTRQPGDAESLQDQPGELGSAQQRRGNQDDMRASMRREADSATDVTQQIQSSLAATVNAAFDGDFEDFTDHLSKADRDRLDRDEAAANDDFRQASQELNRVWNAKFQRSIDWNDSSTLGRVFALPISRATGASAGSTNADSVRIVRVPATSTNPESELRMVQEGMLLKRWYIDAPDTMTATRLRSDLAQALRSLANTGDSWPSDPMQAAETVAQRVLSTVAMNTGSTSGLSVGSPAGGATNSPGNRGAGSRPGSTGASTGSSSNMNGVSRPGSESASGQGSGSAPQR